MTTSTSSYQMPRPDPDVELGRLLWLVLALAGGVLGLFLHLALNWYGPRMECREEVDDDCGEGLICDGGRCVIDDGDCNEGDPCDGTCSCNFPRECNSEQLCVSPTVEPKICENPDAKTILRDLREKQEACGETLARCETARIDEYMTKRENFEGVLADFGEIFIVVFDDAKPALRETHDLWPSQKEREHYLELLRRRLPQLRESGYIIAFARAKQSNNKQQDFLFAQRRMQFFEDDLLEVISGEDQRAGGITAKRLQFLVGPDAPLTAEQLAKIGGDRIRIVAPSSMTENKINKVINDIRSGQRPSRSDGRKANDYLNRSVVVALAPACSLEGER